MAWNEECHPICAAWFDGEKNARTCAEALGEPYDGPWESGCCWSNFSLVTLGNVRPGERCILPRAQRNAIQRTQEKVRDCEIEGSIIFVPWMDACDR